TAEFTVGEGELMTHDEPFFMAPDDKHDLISGTCSHLPKLADAVSLVNQSAAVLGNKPATVVANASSVQVKGSC
ncbi:hypothetical protein, partial [Aeromonas caviae]|uniref:hypothetical protein n=3 Tax=Aeromonas caviae TaxID=648 RepID=UPI001FB8BD63